MITQTIQLGIANISAGASAGLLAYERIDRQDVYPDDIQRITRGLFSGNAASLATFFTSSAQSASSGQYYYDVYDKAGSDSSREVQFSVAYGNYTGAGGKRINASSNFVGSQDTPTRAIYAQYAQTLLATDRFNINSANENSIYVINFKRSRLKDKLDPGNWELNLRVSSTTLTLKDDSTASGLTTPADSEFYKVVKSDGTGDFGWVYPKRGIIVLSGAQLDSALNLGTITSTDTNGNNAFKLFTAIKTAGDNSLPFKARNEEQVKSSHYFLRVRNSRFNFSNNPSYITSSANGTLTFSQPTFARDPKTYITTVGLFNDNNEMLAVGKLSKPILKSYANEILLKVKLDF